VLRLNGVARELLGAEPGTGLERWLERRPGLAPLADFLAEGGQEPRESMVRLAEGEGEGRDWTLSWVPLPGHGGPAAILVVDDDTEVLRGQRLEAWAEMARIIAHEIKNPLTPIQLSTEHMRRVWSDDRDGLEGIFERCTDNILQQVGELRELASNFSIYSRIPRAELVPGDLVEAVEELVAVYRDAAVGGSEIELHTPDEPLAARFDRKLLGRAVRNLMENALRANGGRGTIKVLLEVRGAQASLRVADTGPGVDPKMLRRIFDPYFSTYDTGTGLGLAITRRIVEEHGGEIEARNLEAGGLEVELLLPLTPPAGGGEAGPPKDPRHSED
jgi:nitrogen fixation/metabolism regulation signal transduction histidine kinase